MKIDGEAVFDYLKRVKNIENIGVHGESMGGIVASHLANHCKIDFMFADRTFSSLKNVVRVKCGIIVPKILEILTCWTENSTSDVFEADCYKVLSCDPQDKVVSDLASLKSGLALKIIEYEQPDNRLNYTHILNSSELSGMLNSYTALLNLLENANKKQDNSNRAYRLVGKNSEIDDETINCVLYRATAAIEMLDAGGKSLNSLAQEKDKLFSLNLWLIVLDLWGSFYPMHPNELSGTKYKSVEKIEKCIEELDKIFTENQNISHQIIVSACLNIKLCRKYLRKSKII